MKLISVIIPAFNSENWISDSIHSCFNQGYGVDELEVVVIDDGSTDQTIKLINSLSKKYPIHLIQNKKNQGPAISRNIGINNSTSEFISFLDSDDKMLKDKLKTQKKILDDNRDISMVISGLNEIDAEGRHLRTFLHDVPINRYEQEIQVFLGNIGSITPTMFFRRSLISKIGLLNENMKYLEDREFLLRCLSHEKIIYLKIPLTARRITKHGLSNVVSERDFIQSRKQFEELAYAQNPNLKKYIKTYWANVYFGLGRIFNMRGNILKALKCYIQSIRIKINIRALLGLFLIPVPFSIQSVINKNMFKN